MKKAWFDRFKNHIIGLMRSLVCSVLVGVLCGGIGTAFFKAITAVTALRAENEWLLFLLPFVGLLSVTVYKLCHVTDVGTDLVLESTHSQKHVPIALMPAVFVGAVLTHLCGGSAGKEGAALQLGGGISAVISRVLHLDENARQVLTICGMGAFFSAVFGTPIGACIFALEVACVGRFSLMAVFPCLLSSVTAYGVAVAFGVVPERFLLTAVPEMSLSVIWRVLVIAIAAALVSFCFCHALHYTQNKAKAFVKNDWVRIFIGGTVIVLLTVVLGTTAYNGGGIEVIEHVFTQGAVRHEAFLLKILFTVITVAAGFKGGEIIPSFFIGATLGGSLAMLLGLEPALGAAIGMAALFCGVTNCPIATIVLSVELFGGEGLIYIAMAVAFGFLLSGNISLYAKQKLISAKLL